MVLIVAGKNRTVDPWVADVYAKHSNRPPTHTGFLQCSPPGPTSQPPQRPLRRNPRCRTTGTSTRLQPEYPAKPRRRYDQISQFPAACWCSATRKSSSFNPSTDKECRYRRWSPHCPTARLPRQGAIRPGSGDLPRSGKNRATSRGSLAVGRRPRPARSGGTAGPAPSAATPCVMSDQLPPAAEQDAATAGSSIERPRNCSPPTQPARLFSALASIPRGH